MTLKVAPNISNGKKRKLEFTCGQAWTVMGMLVCGWARDTLMGALETTVCTAGAETSTDTICKET